MEEKLQPTHILTESAIKKAGGVQPLSNITDLSRDTIRRMCNPAYKAWPRSIGKIVEYLQG